MMILCVWFFLFYLNAVHLPSTYLIVFVCTFRQTFAASKSVFRSIYDEFQHFPHLCLFSSCYKFRLAMRWLFFFLLLLILNLFSAQLLYKYAESIPRNSNYCVVFLTIWHYHLYVCIRMCITN